MTLGGNAVSDSGVRAKVRSLRFWDRALTDDDARLLLTAAHELVESDEELALATLCIGGGQGGAVLLERVAS